MVGRNVFVDERAKRTKSYESWIRDNILFCFFAHRSTSTMSKQETKNMAILVRKVLMEMLPHETTMHFVSIHHKILKQSEDPEIGQYLRAAFAVMDEKAMKKKDTTSSRPVERRDDSTYQRVLDSLKEFEEYV